jgi:hemolysin activation/secretion protein
MGSPGGLTAHNNAAAFSLLEANAPADYVYDNFSLSRATALPAGLTLASRVMVQRASSNLLFSEQVSLGGQSSVRGYITDTALGSNAVLTSEEIRAPAFSLATLMHLKLPGKDAEQVGAFWDFGHVDQVTRVPDAVNHDDLASVGLDLHAGFDRFVNVSFDIGWQLRTPPGLLKRGGFTDLSVLVGY